MNLKCIGVMLLCFMGASHLVSAQETEFDFSFLAELENLVIEGPRLNVHDFGAVGDGEHLDSPAINAAIEKAAELGGGTVVIPPGRYLSGSIRLKSNIDFHIEKGAEIYAAPVATWGTMLDLSKRLSSPGDPENKFFREGGTPMSSGYVCLENNAVVSINDPAVDAFSAGDKVHVEFYAKSAEVEGRVEIVISEGKKKYVLSSHIIPVSDKWQKIETVTRIPVIKKGERKSVSIAMSSGKSISVDNLIIKYANKEPILPYDAVRPIGQRTYEAGGHAIPLRNSLIWGENLTNVIISGEGMINGTTLHRADLTLTVWQDEKFVDADSWEDYPNQASLRVADKAIALRNCKNVVMKDFSILHGGHHSILPTGCENMLIDGLTVDTQRDGIDPDCCRNYVIRNTWVNASNDDAICLKSSISMGTLVVSENALIQNCTVSAYETGTVLDGTKVPKKGRANGRIKFGTESCGGFRNITILDCRFESCMGLAILSVDGAVAENIHVENITMEDCREYPIYITTGTRHRVPMDTVIGSQIQNVTLKNIVINDCEPMSGIQITGTTQHSIEGLTLENITFVSNGGGTKEQAKRVPPELGRGYPDPDRIGVMPSYGLFARHLKNSAFKNIKLSFKETDHRPAIVFSDVQNVTLDTIRVETAGGVSPMMFQENVSGINVKNSPELKGK